MKSLLKDLFQFKWAPVSRGADLGCKRLSQELPFQEIEVPSGTEKNGWLIPPSWECLEATIKRDGKLLYDGCKSPLGVFSYSLPFSGQVDVETLKQHLFYSEERPEATPYHWIYQYRLHERNWGICVSKAFYESLNPGLYEVDIKIREEQGTLKILEYTLPGTSKDRILIHAHNCHVGQANDDLSGCVAGIEILKRLTSVKNRRLTVTLLLSPELLGSFYWLDKLTPQEKDLIKGAIMLKAVGNDSELKLQHSYSGKTLLDMAASNAMRDIRNPFIEKGFRRIYGNDETVFEASGKGIPSVSFTRYPFPEYHTDDDTPAIVKEEYLEEVVQTVMKTLNILETNTVLQRRFDGLLALSHPRYNLYQPYISPQSVESSETERRRQSWHYLMNDMFQEFNGKTSILELAERYKLPFSELMEYFKKLAASGAISLSPLSM